jgi:hypothetical protein
MNTLVPSSDLRRWLSFPGWVHALAWGGMLALVLLLILSVHHGIKTWANALAKLPGLTAAQ